MSGTYRLRAAFKLIVLVAALAVVAVAIGLVVWLRGGPGPGAVPASSGKDVPVELRADELKFDLWPSRQGPLVVASTVGSRVAELATGLFDDADQARALGTEMERRLAVVLDPSFDRWVEEASRFTTPPDPDRIVDERSAMTFRELWEAGAVGFDHAPIASQGIMVRSIAPDEQPMLLDGSTPGALLRATPGLTSAQYPQPPQGRVGVRAVEVIVPLRYSTIGGNKHDQPSTAVFRLFWSDQDRRWQPYDLILYMGGSGLNKKYPFPYL
ncbi:MAG: hypothetical protein KatS3mg103_0270 [Phycisphaerales bacterium]|nr:MAG: hypothetical protein KatS3mg103_0270 [Phycisphaerales bacterium]